MPKAIETRHETELLPGQRCWIGVTYRRERVSNGHGGRNLGPYWYAYFRPRSRGVSGRLRSVYIGRRWRPLADVLRERPPAWWSPV